MKRAVVCLVSVGVFAILIAIFIFIRGLSNTSTPTDGGTATKEGQTTITTTKKAEPENATEFVQKMNFDTGALTQMAAEMAGGISGVSFKVGEDKYEIYQFSDSAKIQEAKTGSFTINIDGFGKITSKCRVNGNFVMLYSADNQKVFDAFDNVK